MYTQLSALEAFTAKQQGKNVVCRFESHDEYVQLNEVSAESFFNPAYIFAIKLETITVGEFEFTKPYSLDELIEGQEIYFVGASGIILKGTFYPGNKMLIDGVTAGSVQRDAENAITQMKALRSVLGLQCNDPEIIEYEFADQPKEEPEQKKTRRGRKKTENEIQNPKDFFEPFYLKLEQATTHEEVDSIFAECKKLVVDTDEYRVHLQDFIVKTDEKYFQLDQLDIKFNADDTSLKANSDAQVTDSATIIEDYRFQINNAPTVDDVLKIRSLFAANNHLEREQIQSLCVLCEAKIKELNWWESQKQVEVDTNNGTDLIEFKKLKEDAEESIYQEQLTDLVERASKATTPKEVNALVRYTTTWTQEQRAPLIRAISKRLTELPQPKQDEVKIPLISRLQDAPDLKTLELYETEISLAHPSVHKTLQNMAAKRRGELTRSGAE
ncbi:hypothetical protein [uncultured Acinetobacter sp.]|uniref:hypothetical protein n=1 Tax=uncultured Acinetobacter sp. TaxID=165433 RepID=UPI0025900615|nr:hypothetical protein [uncultured Acinetobacter sp.]